MSSIKYEDEALVITLKCSDPAALHSQLMHSITSNMNAIVTSTQRSTNGGDDIVPLLQLLQSILPTERVLNRLYQ